jgi:hypothetical protein
VLGSLMGGGHLPLSGSWADEKAGWYLCSEKYNSST